MHNQEDKSVKLISGSLLGPLAQLIIPGYVNNYWQNGNLTQQPKLTNFLFLHLYFRPYYVRDLKMKDCFRWVTHPYFYTIYSKLMMDIWACEKPILDNLGEMLSNLVSNFKPFAKQLLIFGVFPSILKKLTTSTNFLIFFISIRTL